jgi:hypothetical protein
MNRRPEISALITVFDWKPKGYHKEKKNNGSKATVVTQIISRFEPWILPLLSIVKTKTHESMS